MVNLASTTTKKLTNAWNLDDLVSALDSLASLYATPLHQIFAGLMELFYLVLASIAAIDWTMPMQLAFWCGMICLILYLISDHH